MIGLAEQKALEEVNKTITPRDGTPRSLTPVVNGEGMKGADTLANDSVNDHAHVVEATHGVYGTHIAVCDFSG